MFSKPPHKVIQSGNYLEVYSYDYGNSYYPAGRKKKHIYAPSKEEIKKCENFKETLKEKRKDNTIRARNNLRWLVNSNPDLTKFYTLTYEREITNITESNYNFNLFIKRLKYFTGKNLKYVSVPEIQPKRAKTTGKEVWHYHMLCNAEYIDKHIIEKIWKHGFVKPERVRSIKNTGAYIAKYLTKESLAKKLFGKNSYLISRNLIRPRINLASCPVGITRNDRIIENLAPYIIAEKEYSYKPKNEKQNHYIPLEIFHTTYKLSIDSNLFEYDPFE